MSFSVIMFIAQAIRLKEVLLLYSCTPLLFSTKSYKAGKHMKMTESEIVRIVLSP